MTSERITVYMPSVTRDCKYTTRTVEKGQEWGKYWYATPEEAVKIQLERDRIQKEKYESFKPVALMKIGEIVSEIRSVLNNYEADLDFYYEGDSHGIYDESLRVSVVVGGFEYTKDVEF